MLNDPGSVSLSWRSVGAAQVGSCGENCQVTGWLVSLVYLPSPSPAQLGQVEPTELGLPWSLYSHCRLQAPKAPDRHREARVGRGQSHGQRVEPAPWWV